MPLSLDSIRLCGVFDYGRYSYNFSKVFMFPLSKVLNIFYYLCVDAFFFPFMYS